MIADETSMQVTVIPVSYSEILAAPNSIELIRSYAAECSVPDAKPQSTMYESMEKAGLLKCFAAYLSDQLVGFVSVLAVVMPHTGRLLVNGESIFVEPAQRSTGAGERLIVAAEKYADSVHAPLTWLPRVGSQLDKILSRRSGYVLTHSQYTRRTE